MKKGIALLLATLMCLSLTACGGTGGMRRPLVLTEGGHGQEDTLRPRDEGVEVKELRRAVAEDEVSWGSVVVGSK